MIIKSYLAYPTQGEFSQLVQALEVFPECEVIPALNQEIVVVVTETENKQAEEQLMAKLQEMPTLQLLALVSGHTEGDGSKNAHTEAITQPVQKEIQ